MITGWPSRSVEPLGDQARRDLGRAAGRIADHQPDLPRRIGLRLVRCCETAGSATVAPARRKKLGGGERLTAAL